MPASVVTFGAVCELTADWTTGFGCHPGEADQPQPRLAFGLVEFAELDDGRRLELRADRGWTSRQRFAYGPIDETDERGPGPPSLPVDVNDPWQFRTRQSLTRSVLACVDPDDDESWWRWLIERLAELGVDDVDMAAVRSVPYRVEFGPVLDGELRRRGR